MNDYPSNTDSVAQDQLKSFVRRIESLDDEIKALNDDKADVYKEAKGSGFDTKVLRKVIADRRKDQAERTEFETIYDLYWSALHQVAHAHVENTEEFDAETGEILDTNGTVAETSGGKQDGNAPAKHVAAVLPTADDESAVYEGSNPSGSTTDSAAPAHVRPRNPDDFRKAANPADLARVRTRDEIASDMGLPSEPDPRCQQPKTCGRFSHVALCRECRVAAGLEAEVAA